MNTQTHGHRRYTMTLKAQAQRRIARLARAMGARGKASNAGVAIGLHITPQAAAILNTYQQGRQRREFLSHAIVNAAAEKK